MTESGCAATLRGMRAPWLLVPVSVGCAAEVGEDGDRSAGGRETPRICTESAAPPSTRVRRLSKLELESTAAVLIGDRAKQALDDLDADPQIDGRFSNSDHLVASTSFLSSLHRVADIIGTDFKATVAPGSYDSTCFSTDTSAETCARTFIQTFGKRAFRRSLGDDDVTQLMSVYTAGREAGIDGDAGDRFATGLSWVVRAIVQAPNFLYHAELGDPAAANGAISRMLADEVASSLSFSVVGMPPDEGLSAAAAEDRLSTPDARAEQAARLIAAYPEAWKRQLRLFVTEWLGINFSQPEWEKDTAAVPLFSASLKEALKTETELVLGDWATQPDGARLDVLLLSPSTFVNELNAPLYGLSALGTAFQKVSLDATQRAGILTLGGFLGSTSHIAETSPVLRGSLILEKLLCRAPPPTPANVPPLPPPDASAPTTTRARYETHLTNPTCKGCHELFDPMGNAFEAYDVVGAHRTEQNGFPVDSSGALVHADGSRTPVQNAVELVNALAESPEVRACVARQVFRFATGRDEVAYDACALEDATRTLTDGSGALRDVVLSIVASDTFVTRQVNR